MRSLIAPLYLIASVALSYFAALGLSVIIFIKLGGSGGLTFILPAPTDQPVADPGRRAPAREP